MEEEIRGMYFLKEHQFQEGQKQAAFYSCAILLSNTELGDKERVEPGQGGADPVALQSLPLLLKKEGPSQGCAQARAVGLLPSWAQRPWRSTLLVSVIAQMLGD